MLHHLKKGLYNLKLGKTLALLDLRPRYFIGLVGSEEEVRAAEDRKVRKLLEDAKTQKVSPALGGHGVQKFLVSRPMIASCSILKPYNLHVSR